MDDLSASLRSSFHPRVTWKRSHHRKLLASTHLEEVGYIGGKTANPCFRRHRGHAEAIAVDFDPEQVSYRDLLEFFLQIHDPTTKNRQGGDVGDDYRSAIFYTTERQRAVARDTIADVDASGLWPGKVITDLTPAGPFWEAEPEHQDYLER